MGDGCGLFLGAGGSKRGGSSRSMTSLRRSLRRAHRRETTRTISITLGPGIPYAYLFGERLIVHGISVDKQMNSNFLYVLSYLIAKYHP